ncbi:MAG: hypothetical protein ACOZCO_06400 [Bacteroidota bacterium]
MKFNTAIITFFFSAISGAVTGILLCYEYWFMTGLTSGLLFGFFTSLANLKYYREQKWALIFNTFLCPIMVLLAVFINVIITELYLLLPRVISSIELSTCLGISLSFCFSLLFFFHKQNKLRLLIYTTITGGVSAFFVSHLNHLIGGTDYFNINNMGLVSVLFALWFGLTGASISLFMDKKWKDLK